MQSREMNRLFESALKMKLQEFIDLIDNVTGLLKNENEIVGNFRVVGRLIESPALGEATVIGDLHGDLETLRLILESSNFVEKFSLGRNPALIFLGDYGDRGELSPEVYYVVLKLKETYPKNVVLMRGNHEGPRDLLVSPHDLPGYLRWKFGEEGSKAYDKLYELWGQLYNCVLVKQRYAMVHGGVPAQAKSLQDVAFAHLKHPRESFLEEILWSDPEENLIGTSPSHRGAGRLFGEDVTTAFLAMLNISVLIRGHEPSEKGYKINHHGKVLTLFSRRGEPYHNSQAAYLQLDLSAKVANAYQLKNSLTFL